MNMNGVGRMDELSALLWRERDLLEILFYKLEVEQLLLVSGKTRWLNRVTDEIEETTEKIRGVGLARSVEVAGVADTIGAPENASLADLIVAASDSPWGEILRAHRVAYLELTSSISHLKDANEQLLRAASRATQETLATMSAATHTYDARGFASTGVTGAAHLLDRDV